MLFILAIIPVIVLLVFIYLKDKKEKEPIGLLIGLFFAGMASSITAIIGELVGSVALGLTMSDFPIIQNILLAMFVVGPAEEMGKYLVLWLITWKNKHFDHSYDAIVYAVFVSLGFAGLENVGYVFTNGIGTAFLRMFTSVPGHACFAVFMGFFYSKAKYAAITKNKKAFGWNLTLSMVVPIVLHGIFDAILFAARATGEDIVIGLAGLLWLGFVIAMLVCTFILVLYASKNDYCILTLPDNVQTVYRPRVVGSWTCSCGAVNQFSFCPSCGKQRPVDTTWNCPSCGSVNAFKFCGNCGFPKPAGPEA